MAGQRVCDLYAYGLVQHIPHKSSTAQIYYATTFAGFYFPFADPARIFRGHMLKPFYINASTRTFRSMLIYIYISGSLHNTTTFLYTPAPETLNPNPSGPRKERSAGPLLHGRPCGSRGILGLHIYIDT